MLPLPQKEESAGNLELNLGSRCILNQIKTFTQSLVTKLCKNLEQICFRLHYSFMFMKKKRCTM